MSTKNLTLFNIIVDEGDYENLIFYSFLFNFLKTFKIIIQQSTYTFKYN